MRKILKLFAQTSILLLLSFGIFKSYDFYKQNKTARKINRHLQINSSEKSFTILIFGYNNNAYAEKSLSSAMTQNYKRFQIVYIDDASTDGSSKKIARLLSQSPHKEKVTLISNPKSKGSLACLYEIVHTLPNHEIVVFVDGNDFLAHENVLSKLNKVYSKPSVWLTYGNFLDYPSYKQIPIKCKQFPKNVVFNNSFRSHEMIELHLKTFYAGLFKQIQKEDLLYKDTFFSKETTLAYFLPLLEMAGKHAQFINEILYLHTKSKPAECEEQISYIKKLPYYKRLKTLPLE